MPMHRTPSPMQTTSSVPHASSQPAAPHGQGAHPPAPTAEQSQLDQAADQALAELVADVKLPVQPAVKPEPADDAMDSAFDGCAC